MVCVLSTIDTLFASGLLAEFPRGPGDYFSVPKFLAILCMYLLWVRMCSWVDQDAIPLGLPRPVWNTVLWADGVFGLLVVWLLPWFGLSFLFLVILTTAPVLTYVYQRNQKVARSERVLTPEHIQALLSRYLKMDFKRKSAQSKEKDIPVRFIGKSFGQAEEDRSRVVQAEGSKGYRAARRMVYEAVEARATDIHLEPTRDEMTIRLRIDGILQQTAPFSRAMGESIVNIFKVLGEMDIAERRKPQDGSFSAQVEDRLVDFRIASAGGVIGEKLVLRILDNSKQIARLTQVGMQDSLRDKVQRIVSQPHGMFISCGPTGAGKTTTLYACLNEIDRFTTNVITIENPVEYKLSNATQIEVNPKAGKTFASELRSILRQDPDVILIGEIRDNETAEIACQAAQTGHLVLTTLHANDTVTALARLIDLGVQPFMIANAVSAILGQRLLRVLCPECKVRYKPTPEELRRANLPADKIKSLYRPPKAGERAEESNGQDGEEPEPCEHCGGKGYFGRTGIFEMLVVSDHMRDLVRENPDINAIRAEAVKTGMKYLLEEGLWHVLQGNTSLAELLRVCK